MDSAAVFELLTEHQIVYQRFDHPPVFTCEEARAVSPNLPGAETKNLFLRDGKGKKHFLLTVGADKTVNLKALSTYLGVSGLSFASPERLKKYLGVDPGSVTLLGAVNDLEKAVEVLVDRELWKAESLQCHPLVNTITIVMARTDLERLLTISGHDVRPIDVPVTAA